MGLRDNWAEGVVSKPVEVVPIPLHPIIQFSFMFIVYW